MNFVRGCINAILFSVPLWALLIGLIWWVTR